MSGFPLHRQNHLPNPFSQDSHLPQINAPQIFPFFLADSWGATSKWCPSMHHGTNGTFGRQNVALQQSFKNIPRLRLKDAQACSNHRRDWVTGKLCRLPTCPAKPGSLNTTTSWILIACDTDRCRLTYYPLRSTWFHHYRWTRCNRFDIPGACGIANFTAPTASLRCWSLQCRWGCLCCYSSGGLDIKFGVFSTCPFCREHTWKIHSITTLPFSNYRHIFTLIALSIWAKANRTMFQTLTVSLAIVRLSISLWFSRIFVTFDVQGPNQGCPSQCILVKAQTVEALPLLSQPSSKHVAKASVRIAFQASKCHGPWSKIKWLEIRVPMLTAAPAWGSKTATTPVSPGQMLPKRDHPNWLTPIKNSEVLCLWLTCNSMSTKQKSCWHVREVGCNTNMNWTIALIH